MLAKNQKIGKLHRQIEQIDEVMATGRYSPRFKKWTRDTEVAIEKIFGTGTRHLTDFSHIRYGPGSIGPRTTEAGFYRAYCEGLKVARSILQSFIDEVEEYTDEGSTEARPDALSTVERICTRFQLVARQLRSRHNNRGTLEVEDEYDVQDLLHALLKLEFNDIRTEEWTPSYAGKASRMDFLLKDEGIVVECKKTRKGLGQKEIGDELIIDTQRYQKHPDCRILICFVYDPEGRIGNPGGIERDLSGTRDTLIVKTIVTPKGT